MRNQGVSWKAAIASAIGTRHLQKQLPCQDFGQYLQVGSVLIGAVADGAGSARHADRGARLAVESTLIQLRSQLEHLSLPLPTGQPLPGGSRVLTIPPELGLPKLDPLQSDQLFTTVVEAVVSDLKSQALEGDYPLADLSTTLLAFIATPEWLGAMQIGDGFIVVGSAGSELELLFQPTKGEYINETCFVTSPTALEQMQVKVYAEPPQFICAATDGLERLAIRFQDWLPFPPFFQPLATCLQADPQGATAYLQNFLASDRLNARTDDDKTLLIGWLERESDP
jgi:Protein phosphatase 2C